MRADRKITTNAAIILGLLAAIAYFCTLVPYAASSDYALGKHKVVFCIPNFFA